MSVNIRKAEAGDMAQVLHLINELADFEKAAHEVEITVDDLIAHGTGSKPDFTCFVAEENNEEMVGIALVYYRFSTWKGLTVHLEDLMVKKEKRGQGIGMALYTEVINYAHEQGVRRLEWIVLDWNKGAIDFYKASGADVMDHWYTVQMNGQQIETFLKEKGKIK